MLGIAGSGLRGQVVSCFFKTKTTVFNSKNSKSMVRQGLASTAHFVVAMDNKNNPWYHVSDIMTKRKLCS